MLFIVISIVSFLCMSISMVPCLFNIFKSRYDICLFLSSVIANCSALCCLLNCSDIYSGVILVWL
jgi:hypothetical protein